MKRIPAAAMLLASMACAAPAAAAVLDDAELTLLGSAASGDYGAGLDVRTEWLAVRYIAGDDLQVRVDLSMVSVEASTGGALPGLGPTVTDDRRRLGSRDLGSPGTTAGGEPQTGGSMTGPVSSLDSRTTGLGDLYLAVAKRLAGGGVRLFRLDTNLEVKVPTASESDGLGTGAWDYRVGFAGEYRSWSATTWGGLGWNRLGDPDGVEIGDVVDAFVGVDSVPLLRERVIVSGWVEGRQEAVDSSGNPASLGVGVQTTGKVRFGLQVRRGLTDSAPAVGVVFGISFGVSPAGPGIRGAQL